MQITLPAEPPAAYAAADCADVDLGRTRLVVEQVPARPVSTLRVSAMTGQWGEETVPTRCLTDWRLSSSTVALNLRQNHQTLIVGPDAIPGEMVEISALAGGRRVTVSVRIVGANELVLTGFWAQKSVACVGDRQPVEPVRELHFDDKGGYSVTFIPFETYKDYWGSFTLDAATGDLVMTYEDGNRGGADLDLTGKARLEPGGDLVLEDLYLGDRQGPPQTACRYVFGQ